MHGGGAPAQRVAGRHGRLHQLGAVALLDDQFGDAADRSGPPRPDVHRLAVGLRAGQGEEGALGDVIDVHQVADLVAAPVEVQR